MAYPGIAHLSYTVKEVSGTSSLDIGEGSGGGRLKGGNGQQASGQAQGQSYIFIAQSQEPTIDVRNGQAKVVVQATVIGLAPTGPNRLATFAIVGRGDFATIIR